MHKTNDFSLYRLAETGSEPVSLAEAKAHCRVDTSDEDSYFLALITAARMHAEAVTGLALVDSQWRLDLDRFPNRPHYTFDALCDGHHEYVIRVPRSPIAAIVSITYYDVANTQQTLPTTAYESDGERIAPVFGQHWPATWPGIAKVSVTFTTVANVPTLLKQALLLTVASWYANREDVVVSTGQAQTLPRAAEHIFNLFKTSHIGYEVAR